MKTKATLSNDVNKLLITIAIQRYYKRENKRGVTVVYMWHSIRKVIPMSRSVFYSHLNKSAAMLLNKRNIDLKRYEPRILMYITVFTDMQNIE